ncbi:MAG: hypothetical protein AB7L36_06775 [Sphingomonadaceae bacterium]
MSGLVNGNGGFASLTSSLLARKGGARPAMRSSAAASLDDLGWNDMGEEALPTPVAAEADLPHPIRYQEAIADQFAAKAEVASVELKPVVEKTAVVRSLRAIPRVVRKAPREGVSGKIAFTLRLDTERHLRLRLATAVTGRSAQKIVSEALDAFLAQHPEIEQLADQVPQRKAEGRS